MTEIVASERQTALFFLPVAAFCRDPHIDRRNEIGGQSTRLETAQRAIYLNEFYKFRLNRSGTGARPASEEEMR